MAVRFYKVSINQPTRRHYISAHHGERENVCRLVLIENDSINYILIGKIKPLVIKATVQNRHLRNFKRGESNL